MNFKRYNDMDTSSQLHSCFSILVIIFYSMVYLVLNSSRISVSFLVKLRNFYNFPYNTSRIIVDSRIDYYNDVVIFRPLPQSNLTKNSMLKRTLLPYMKLHAKKKISLQMWIKWFDWYATEATSKGSKWKNYLERNITGCLYLNHIF